jgi:5-methylcytosine-specific restriction endonuclease McrA
LVKPGIIKTIEVKAVNTIKNPYYDKEYFDSKYKVLTMMEFRRKVYKIHNYKCAACGEILDDSESIELHRINPGKDGGEYTLKNTVPLHKTCHESVTFAKNQ